ncbi:hypothetical protein DM785_17105 (plasmid) [Deinococcus actinosclerus]|nr:hypothetical protein DM785_17105 [Deinococcus actinosclerus]
MQDAAHHVQLLRHEVQRRLDVQRGLPLPATRGVDAQRVLEAVREPQVIDDQSVGLVREDAVHAGDRLHQAVALHGLVEVHGVQAEHVEAREPHVTHDHELHGTARVPEVIRDGLVPRLAADVVLPGRIVVRTARHHDLDHAFLVAAACPLGPQADQFVVQRHADPAGHRHDHALVIQDTLTRLEVRHEVLRDRPDALWGAHQGFQRRPLRLELLAAAVLLPFGDLLEFLVQGRPGRENRLRSWAAS